MQVLNKLDKIYYINLDRRPDRNEHFLKQCVIHNLDFNIIKRFTGIDGLTFNFSEQEKNMFNNVDFKGKPFEKNIMGNQLSHYNILKEMIENDYEYILILQDDVIFRNNFTELLNNILNNIPTNAEIINIGLHKVSVYNHFIPWDLTLSNDHEFISKNKINNEICILQNNINPCSLSYIVTLQGAKNLLKHFDTNGFLRATDCNYNDYLQSKNIFYGSNIVLCTGNQNLGSDISPLSCFTKYIYISSLSCFTKYIYILFKLFS
jgi:GR25 family glycosyltransferase involved in LPS biosynthesis